VVAIGSNFKLTQEKYDHLVSLLQQANLLSSASPRTGPISNHINTSIFPATDSLQIGIFNVVSCSIDSAPHYWILDSGANDHVCSSLSSFTSFYKIKPIHVNLPNGSSILVQHAGNVSFSSSLYLTKVLYSPTFNLNLISVSKLCKSLSCFVQFSSDSCIIQDLSTKKMICVGENLTRLYRLVVNADFSKSSSFHCFNKKVSTLCNNVSQSVFIVIPSSAVWHFRLGHLSHQRLSQMQSLYPSNTNNATTYPISDFLLYNKLPNAHLHFALSLTTHTEPKSYVEASKFDCWNKAMETEL